MLYSETTVDHAHRAWRRSLILAACLVASTLFACTTVHQATVLYPEGQRKTQYEYFVEDQRQIRQGTYREWYENGRLKAEGTYVEGRRDGQWTFFHATGSKRSRGQFDDGRRVGTWSFWTKGGKLHARVTYPKSAHGEVKREHFDVPDEREPIVDGKPVFCENDHLRAVRDAFEPEFQSCIDRATRKDPDLHGRLVAEYRIGLDGEIMTASIEKSSVDDRAVETCIVGTIRRMQYEPPVGGICIIEYPFTINKAQ